MALPVAFLLGFSFNPVDFLWSFHHGLDPMPEDVRERAAKIGRYACFLGDGLILGFVVILALKNSLAPARLGLHFHNWQTNAALGVTAVDLLLFIHRLFGQYFPPRSSPPFFYLIFRGLVFLFCFFFFLWCVFLDIVGCVFA